MADELKYRGHPANHTGITLIGQVLNDVFVSQGNVNFSEVGSTAGFQGDIPTLTAGFYYLDLYEDSVDPANYIETFEFNYDGQAILSFLTINSKTEEIRINTIT